MPGRVIESDVIMFASHDRRVINRPIKYEESDHHKVRPAVAKLHKRRYPRHIEAGEQAYLDEWEE
jgi:hypothetical protein